MGEYRLTASAAVLRADGALIPPDHGNSDYQAYLEWVAEGGTADPAFGLSTEAEAASDLAERIANGIAITCTGNAALNAIYALDDETMAQIGAVARDAASGLGLPGGASTFIYPDIDGAPRTFTASQIIDAYKAMRDLIFVLSTQAAITGHGGFASWPTQAATIA